MARPQLIPRRNGMREAVIWLMSSGTSWHAAEAAALADIAVVSAIRVLRQLESAGVLAHIGDERYAAGKALAAWQAANPQAAQKHDRRTACRVRLRDEILARAWNEERERIRAAR